MEATITAREFGGICLRAVLDGTGTQGVVKATVDLFLKKDAQNKAQESQQVAKTPSPALGQIQGSDFVSEPDYIAAPDGRYLCNCALCRGIKS